MRGLRRPRGRDSLRGSLSVAWDGFRTAQRMPQAVAAIAGRQQGVVTRRADCAAAGLSDEQVDALGPGRSHPSRLSRRLRRWDTPTSGPRGRIQAAALACPGAVISHRSAASLLGFGEAAPRVVDVIPTVERGTEDRRDQASPRALPRPSRMVRVTGSLHERGADDRRPRGGLRGEGVAGDGRAGGDGAAAGPRRRSTRCSQAGRETARGALPAPGDRGVATRRGDGEVRDGAEPLRGEALAARRRRRAADAAHQCAGPDRGARPRGRPPLGPTSASSSRPTVAAITRIEVAFERDRKRDLELLDVNYGVLRVTWKQVEREPQKVFAVVRSELERRRPAASNGAAS